MSVLRCSSTEHRTAHWENIGSNHSQFSSLLAKEAAFLQELFWHSMMYEIRSSGQVGCWIEFTPVAGEETGAAQARPKSFRFELNSPTKVEFCVLKWAAVNGSYSFQVFSMIVRLCTVVFLCNLE